MHSRSFFDFSEPWFQVLLWHLTVSLSEKVCTQGFPITAFILIFSASGSNFHPTPPEAYTTPQTLLSLESIFDPNVNTQPNPSPQRRFSPNTEVLYSRPLPGSSSVPSWIKVPSPARDTLPSSAQASDDEDENDPLTASAMGPWDNMFSLAEAARLKQDGHLVRENKGHPFDFAIGDHEDAGTGARKLRKKRKRKAQTGMSDDEFLEMKRALPMRKGNQVHAFKDVIELGICSLEKGKELYEL